MVKLFLPFTSLCRPCRLQSLVAAVPPKELVESDTFLFIGLLIVFFVAHYSIIQELVDQ